MTGSFKDRGQASLCVSDMRPNEMQDQSGLSEASVLRFIILPSTLPQAVCGSLPSPGQAPFLAATTFLARALNLSPFFCVTVIVTWPVLLVFISLMMPDFPA